MNEPRTIPLPDQRCLTDEASLRAAREFDSLMQRAASQTDPRLRKAYLEEAEVRLLRDHPMIPIYFFVNKHMVSPSVIGWGDNVLNYHYSQHLSLGATEQDGRP